MESVERLLPNGFHDGVLRRVSVDYALATLTLDVEFWIGDLDDEARRELYRLGRVTVSGLELFMVEPPSKAQTIGAPVIDGGPGQPATSPIPLPSLPSDSFLYWLFVNESNSFIRFCGREARLEWLGEETLSG
jgi:hypothetical protein